MSDVSPGAFPLIRISLGVIATASARSPLAMESLSTAAGLSIIIDIPTVTTKLPSIPGRFASCEAGFSCGVVAVRNEPVQATTRNPSKGRILFRLAVVILHFAVVFHFRVGPRERNFAL